MMASAVVIVAEVEEGVAVVAVDAEVSSRQELQADAGVPAELGRADVQICGAVERFHFAPIPPRPTQQEGSNLTAAHPQEERRLYRSLREFLVEDLRRLGMPVHRHLEANPSADDADLAAEIADGIHVGFGVRVDPRDAPAHPKTLGRHWCQRGQQPTQGEHRDDGTAVESAREGMAWVISAPDPSRFTAAGTRGLSVPYRMRTAATSLRDRQEVGRVRVRGGLRSPVGTGFANGSGVSRRYTPRGQRTAVRLAVG